MWNFVLKIERQVVSFALNNNSKNWKTVVIDRFSFLLEMKKESLAVGCKTQYSKLHCTCICASCNPPLNEAVNKLHNVCVLIIVTLYNIYGHSTIFFHHRAQVWGNLLIHHPSFGCEIAVQWVERTWIWHVVHPHWSWLVCLLPFLQCHTSDIHCQKILETLQDMKEDHNEKIVNLKAKMCRSRNIHTSPTEGHGNFQG